MHNFPCKRPSQNYVEQLVNDVVADRFSELDEVIEQVHTTVGDSLVTSNLNSIARIFGAKDGTVANLATGLNVTSLSILFDLETQTSWYRGEAIGAVTSWSIANSVLTLVTALGSYTLQPATVLTSVGSALNLDYGSL